MSWLISILAVSYVRILLITFTQNDQGGCVVGKYAQECIVVVIPIRRTEEKSVVTLRKLKKVSNVNIALK